MTGDPSEVVRELVVRTRKRQGLPTHVTDGRVVASVAAVLTTVRRSGTTRPAGGGS